jgi:hypothetical protein
MKRNIKFPIMDIAEFVFESERVFFSSLNFQTNHTSKEKYVKKIPLWTFVDSEGKLLKVRFTRKEEIKNFLSFLVGRTYKIELELYPTGKIFELKELKNKILEKKNKMFHIYYNKLITLEEYERKINNATNFLEIIDIASFEEYKEEDLTSQKH